MTDETPRALFPAGGEITPATPPDSPIFFGMAMNRTAKLGPMRLFKIQHATFDEPAKRQTSYAAVYMMPGQMMISTDGTVVDCLVPVAPMWDEAIQADTKALVFERRGQSESVAAGYLAEVFDVCGEAREMVLRYWVSLKDTEQDASEVTEIINRMNAVLKSAHDYMKANGKDGGN